MAREFPIWVVVLLPWLGALGCLLAARPGVRLLGPERVKMFAHYLGLGASALGLLFMVQAIQQLLVPEDPRALAHTALAELLEPVVIGELRVDATLVADRLSSSAALLILALFVLARMFVPGPAGQRALGFGPGDHASATINGLRRLALLGLLEGAALLVVLASDVGLAAIGWALLGVGGAILIAQELGDERRASAATRVLALGIGGDLGLGAVIVALVAAGIGLAHNNLWAPLTGERLYSAAFWGLSFGDLIALLLLGAVCLRLSSLAWAGNSLAEALLDAVLIPVPALYLLLRYQRVLSYAPSVLAGALVVGVVVALAAAAIGLARPERGRGHTYNRVRTGVGADSGAGAGAGLGAELGLAGAGMAWVGVVLMAIGVGAWRTVALLLLAHALGRLGLRLALLVANHDQLPPWTARIGRVLCWAVAGIAPGLGYVVLAQTLVDLLSRTSVLGSWVAWPAGVALLLVAFMHAAGIARIWYEGLGRKPGAAILHPDHAQADDEDEDGLDFAPLLILFVALLGLGVMAFGSWFAVFESPLAWLDKILPLAGGHEVAPTGLRESMRDGASVARPWVAGSAALVALVSAFAWMWTRERFRRASGGELSGLVVAIEPILSWPRALVRACALVLSGLTELAARGIGRGLFEEGPRVAASLARDLEASVAPRLRRLSPGGGRQALLGVIVGFGLVLAWLYAKPDVASALPRDDYGFGGLRPKLIRAGGGEAAKAKSGAQLSADAVEQAQPSADVVEQALPPRRDGAEPARLAPPPEAQR